MVNEKDNKLAEVNKQINTLMREAVRKKQLNGTCYQCGAPKRIMLQNACILPLAVEGDKAYEITIAVACAHCGAITQYLSSLLFTAEEMKQLDELAAQMKEIMEKEGE